MPFRHDENVSVLLRTEDNSHRNDVGISLQEDLGSLAEQFRDYGFTENKMVAEGSTDEENVGVNVKASKLFGRSQVQIEVMNELSLYDE